MPHLKNFIAGHPSDWLEKLVEIYKIDAVTAGDLVSLKYDQINSPMHEPIVQECRGAVVHVPTGTVLAYPYNKFWSHGEHLAAPIDWATARVQDKLDGSLMILYRHPSNGAWQVASSGHPVAGGPFGKQSISFEEAFWNTWRSLRMKLPSAVFRRATIMFEFCSLDNKVVCRYPTPRIVLHGARWTDTEREFMRVELAGLADEIGAELVREWSVADVAQAISDANALDPTTHEGFVVVDDYCNRVKIKNPRYVALHHLKGNGAATTRRSIALWKAGEIGELLTHFPELAADVQPVLDKLDVVANRAYDAYAMALRDNPDRKTFAMRVKDAPYAAICFRLFGITSPVREDAFQILRGMLLSAIEQMLDSFVWDEVIEP